MLGGLIGYLLYDQVMGVSGLDEMMLRRALGLAVEAAAFASPNPAVGCVLEREGVVVGEGAHRYAAFDHAEIVALKQAAAGGHAVRGGTAYVTLEPCSHHGRTGPCAEALVEAGIARCVVATVDPNPKVSGAGVAKMRAAGVEVVVLETTDEIAVEARRLMDAFAFSIRYRRPFVTLKAALSVDGKLAPPPTQREVREPVWLTGEAARADGHLLRQRNDALVTGIGTVLADDPALTDRSGLARRRPLLRVVLDSSLRTPLESRLVEGARKDLLVVASGAAGVDAEAALVAKGVDVVRLASDALGGVDLEALLAELHKRDVRSVLLEAGAGLNGAFLSAGLVDRLVFYVSEVELGAEAVAFARGGFSPYRLQERLIGMTRVSFTRSSSGEAAGEDVKIAGYVRDPWAGVSVLHS